MLKMSVRMRTKAPQHSPDADRHIGSTTGKRAATGSPGGLRLILLSMLFWSIFYQNLPTNLGLNAPTRGLNAVDALEVAAPGKEDTGNTVNRIFKVAMLVMSVFVIATRWSLTRALIKTTNVGFVALMVIILLSVAWSIDPPATILRCITLASIVLVCFAISLTGWDRQRFQQLTIPPLMYILVTSLMVGMMYPDLIIERGDDLSLKNAWHGITLTKNQLGMAASLGLIIYVNRLLARKGRMLWDVAGTGVAFACLILSRSNTSLLAAMVAVLFMVLVMRVPVIKKGYSTHVVVGLVAVLIMYECVIQDVLPGAHTLMAPIRAMTGKDGTLSARTIIWDIIKQHIQMAPYLGTGYGAYWPLTPTPSSPSYVFLYLMYFYPSEAHNGYLEIVNDLGYLGLAGLAVFLISYARQGLELMRFDRSQAALYLALLFQQMVMNMSESEWFARDNAFTIIILGITCMARELHESRLRP
jgi:exopolysaccharide production protein ExoQ